MKFTTNNHSPHDILDQETDITTLILTQTIHTQNQKTTKKNNTHWGDPVYPKGTNATRMYF